MNNKYWQILISQQFKSFYCKVYCNVLGIIDNILDSITEYELMVGSQCQIIHVYDILVRQFL